LDSFIISLFLAYYWTGFEMVEFHSLSHPIDRPSYVNNPLYKKAISALLWPIVTRLNFEFGWFFSCFISYVVVITFFYSICVEFTPAWIVIGGVIIIRQIPMAGVIFNAPAALIASIVFMPLSKLFGWKVPAAMSRMSKK
jgi:hypothetical protein